MSKEQNIIGDRNFKGLLIPVILVILSLTAWDSVVLLPIKLLTVFFHETSHALAALLTGGTVVKLEIGMNQGGACWSYGSWRLITTSAGYLGSLLWGVGILWLSQAKGINRGLTKTLGIILVIVALLWMRDLESLLITIGLGVALFYAATKLKETYCAVFIKYISLISCFYVVFDIKEDLMDRTVPMSDAYQISKMIFPSFMVPIGSNIVGFVWLLIAIFLLWKVFSAILNPKGKNKEVKLV